MKTFESSDESSGIKRVCSSLIESEFRAQLTDLGEGTLNIGSYIFEAE